MTTEATAGVLGALIVLVVLVALFLVFRQFVLWYFRINERTELLRDIRDSLRQRSAGQAWQQADPQARRAAEAEQVGRRLGESDDQYNSRVADEMQRQIRR